MERGKKGIWSLCLLCLALLGCMAWMPGKTQAAKSDFTIQNGVLTAYSGKGRHVTIPGGVTKIGKVDWPYYVTSVTIPGTVKEIGKEAFYWNTIQKVEIKKGVQKIEEEAFSCCGLTSVTIPGSVKSIGDWAFEYCDSLKTLTIEKGVSSIGDDAFWFCDALTSAAIPNGMKKIGEDAFAGCKKLKSVTIPESIKEIGMGAFDETVKAHIKGRPVFRITNNSFVNGGRKLTCKSINNESLSVTADGKVTVKGKGSAAVKVLVNNSHAWTFHIVTEAPTPPQVVMTKAEWKDGKAIFKWKKLKQASGYQYLFAYDEDFTNPLKGDLGNKTSITLSSFRTKQKRLYIKIRAYIKEGKKTYYGKWSDAWYLSLKD